MVFSIYKRFSESTNFCSKERWLRPVAKMLGHVKIVNPCYFIATRGKLVCIYEYILANANRQNLDPIYMYNVGVAMKIACIYYYAIKRDGAVKYTIFFRCEKCVCEVIISAKTYPHADVKHSFYL